MMTSLNEYGTFIDTFESKVRYALQSFGGQSYIVNAINPIALTFYPIENSLDLSDCAPFGELEKALLTLSQVCLLLRKAAAYGEKTFLPKFMIYDEQVVEFGGKSGIFISRNLSLLQELKEFYAYTERLLLNVFQQLIGLQATFQKNSSSLKLKKLHLWRLFMDISSLLRMLVALRAVMNSKIRLMNEWTDYKLKVRNHDCSENNLLFDFLQSVECTVDGTALLNLFSNISASFRDHLKTMDFAKKEMLFSITKCLFSSARKAKNSSPTEESFLLLNAIVLLVLYTKMFGPVKKATYQLLNNALESHPLIIYNHSLVLKPVEVLWEFLPDFRQFFRYPDFSSFYSFSSVKFWNFITANMDNCTNAVYESIFGLHKLCLAETSMIRLSYYAFLKLLLCAEKTYYNAYILLNLQLLAGCQFTLQQKKMLISCLFSLKLLQSTFSRFTVHFHECFWVIVHHLKERIYTYTVDFQKHLRPDKLKILKILQNCFEGLISSQKIITSEIAVEFLLSSSTLSESKLRVLNEDIHNLIVFTNFSERFSRAVGCEFLYRHQYMYPTIFNYFLENENDVSKLPLCLSAFSDSLDWLNLYDSHEVARNYASLVIEILKQELIAPVSYSIEDFLRLSIREDGIVGQNSAKNDLRLYCELPPIRFNDKIISFKDLVEEVIESTFYNQFMLALFDWKSYERMRYHANQAFSLSLINSILSCPCAEQSLDFFSVTQNMPSFFQNSFYDFSRQAFVTDLEHNKTLKSVDSENIGSFIQLSGMASAKMLISSSFDSLNGYCENFCQYFVDHKIQTVLLNEVNFVRMQQNSKTRYSFDNAKTFRENIRKISGPSFINDISKTVSCIGNIICFIKVTVAAVNRIISKTSFMFDEHCNETTRGSSSSESMQTALTVLNDALDNRSGIHKSLKFTTLFEDFKTNFMNAGKPFEKNFFVILPCVVYDFLERSAQMRRGSRHFIKPVDDGFIVGSVFLLRLFDVYEEFQSLNWFSSLRSHFVCMIEEINMRQAQRSGDAKLKEIEKLDLRNYEEDLSELDLLNDLFTITSAIFRFLH